MSRRQWPALCTVVLAVFLMSCESTHPTAPSSPFTVATPTSSTLLSCPANIQILVNHDRPVPVMFAAPSITGLGPVAKSSCTPTSGSSFSIGSTLVRCSAAETEFARSCSFSVTVLSRTLGRTSFLAFGDSITSGTLSVARSLAADSGISTSYPALMEAMIEARYPDQTLTIINAGKPGERAIEGRRRAPQVLDAFSPDVMLLLEGINHLVHLTPAAVAEDLDSIVRSAQQRGVQVLIATLTQIGPVKERDRPGTREAVDDLNRRIRSIARTRNLGPVVDLFGAMRENPHLFGDDGLHPTTEGYRVMAEEFLGAIVSRYELVDRGESP